jgi:hypothetical protein
MPVKIMSMIQNMTQATNANFPRVLDKVLCPVIRNAKISSPNASASTVFLSGFPFAVQTWRQFLAPVDGIFNPLDERAPAATQVQSPLIV